MGVIEGNRYQFTHDELWIEGRPFASADADRISVKHTGKDDVGTWLNHFPSQKLELESVICTFIQIHLLYDMELFSCYLEAQVYDMTSGYRY